MSMNSHRGAADTEKEGLGDGKTNRSCSLRLSVPPSLLISVSVALWLCG
jgi:hypothetical protein